VAKIAKKSRFFVNSALKLQWHIVKNTLLQTAFNILITFEIFRNKT